MSGLYKNNSQSKKAARYILTESQRKRWEQIIKNVPEANRVYIQASFHQLKAAQRDYQDWGNVIDGLYDMIEKEENSKKTVSLQGFEGKPDFPKIDI